MNRIVCLFIYLVFAIITSAQSEIVEISKKADTLSIITESKWLYYPFGKLNSLSDVEAHIPITSFEVQKLSNDGDSVLMINSHKNEVFLIKDNSGDAYDTTFMVVYADILNKNIMLNNNIAIGNPKSEVCAVLGINHTDASHIELISALDGVWISLAFENDTLCKICIRTDYDFSSNADIKDNFKAGLFRHGNLNNLFIMR